MDKNSCYGKNAYSVGGGFFRSPYDEARLAEKKKIRSAGNGIGLSALGYVGLSFFTGTLYAVLSLIMFPAASIRGAIYVTETADWIINILIYVISLALPFGIYVLCIKMPLSAAVPIRRARADLTFGGLFVGIGASVIASYATAFLQSALASIGIGLTYPEFETPETLPGIVLYLVSMVIAPAFLEEIVFRGVIMQSLRRFGDFFALVASSLIFGIFHFNLVQMPYAFIMGLFIGYFVMRSGSLWVGILIHFVNNSVAAGLELLAPYMTDEQMMIFNVWYDLAAVILAGIAFVILIIRHRDMFRFAPSGNILSPGERTRTFIGSPGVVLALVAAVFLTMQYVYLI